MPTADAYLPKEQETHNLDSEPEEKVPMGQGAQAVEPRAGAAVPLVGQATQVSMEVAPVAAENLPAAQRLQIAAPAVE